MHIKNARAGFTFLEVLLVVAITVIVSVISVIAIAGWKRQHDLNTTAQKIATLLREAQVRAMSQERGASWGMYFSNNSTTPFAALFYGDAYSTSTQQDYLSLPGAVIFNTSTLPLNSTSVIVFSQISGEVDPSKSRDYEGDPFNVSNPFSLNILLGTDNPGNAQSSTIDVSSIGQIRFVTLSCLVVCSQTSVVLQPTPTLVLSANPSSVSNGESTALSWTATDATSCDASWTTSHQTSGTKTLTPSGTTAYAMTCTGQGGSVAQSVTVTVTFPQPTLTIWADPSELPAGGGEVIIRWNTTNIDSCSATWTNKHQPSGFQFVGEVTETTVFAMTCTGPGWQITNDVEVLVEGSGSGGGGGGGGGGQGPQLEPL